MSETKTLQERLRVEAAACRFASESADAFNAEELYAEGLIHDEAADALDAKDALLREAQEVLRPFCERPDDWTVDQVNHARALLLKLNEAQK